MTEDSHGFRPRLGRLFLDERLRLIRLVRWKIHDLSSHEAEDLVQDVVHNILSRADMAGQIEDLAAYLYRSLSNRIIDHQRRRKREVPLTRVTGDSEEESEQLIEPVSSDPDPEQHLIRRQRCESLQKALDSLSDQERFVWVETELNGRTTRELAEELQVPAGTLLARKSRAGKRLRRILKNERRV